MGGITVSKFSLAWMQTEVTADQPSQTVHINLLDGALRVNGQLLGGLPYEVREIFRDVCICCDF